MKKGSALGCSWIMLAFTAFILSMVFAVLRVVGVITMHWFWVFSPIIFVTILPMFLLGLATIFVMIDQGFEDEDDEQ